MRQVFLLFILIALYCIPVYSTDTKYAVSNIPSELKANAKAVIRYENVDFKVISVGHAIQKVHYAITILNKNGEQYSFFVQSYDKFSKVSNIKATVYNENGKIVKRIMPNEIRDYSEINGYTLYQDLRIKAIDPENKSYPFTFEYSYEIEYSGFINFPTWTPYKDYNISVQESNFLVTVPANYHLRFLEKNIQSPYQKVAEEGKSIFQWQATNLKSIIEEDYSSIKELLPTVYIAPSEVLFGGYAGNFESWQNFGKWINQLNTGRNILDSEAKNFIQTLTKDDKSDTEKIKTLYEFLQNKTRYVSIQKGIGGWQPIDAKLVHRNSYGDCKALSNYMHSVLDAAGIKSYYTLISAGRENSDFIPGFPSNQFNHAILCVPNLTDTIWLECTSQKIPFGYLGTFTDDRPALMITDEGGILVHTPVLSLKDNFKFTNYEVNVAKEGLFHANVSKEYSGLFYDEMMRFMQSDYTDQKKILVNTIKIPDFNLNDFNYNEVRCRIPILKINFSLDIKDENGFRNDRITIPVDIMNQALEIPRLSGKRLSDIIIKRSYQIVDTMKVIIPDGYNCEQLPNTINLKSDFGTYQTQSIQSGKNLLFIRRQELFKGVYPPDGYENFVDFFEKIELSDRQKFIITKK